MIITLWLFAAMWVGLGAALGLHEFMQPFTWMVFVGAAATAISQIWEKFV